MTKKKNAPITEPSIKKVIPTVIKRRSFGERIKRAGMGCLVVFGVCGAVLFFTYASTQTPEYKSQKATETAVKQTSVAIAGTEGAYATGTFEHLPTATASDTPTSTPTATITETPTITPVASQTPVATVPPVATITPVVEIPTIGATEIKVIAEETVTLYTAQEANVRTCPSRDCEVITRLAMGMPVELTASVAGEEITPNVDIWYRMVVNGVTGYIYADLITLSAPVVNAQSAAPVSSSGVQVISTSAPVTSGGSTIIQGGGCNGFDTSVCAQYAEPANCDVVKSMGIPSHVAACCFPARDRDGDGEACYGN